MKALSTSLNGNVRHTEMLYVQDAIVMTRKPLWDDSGYTLYSDSGMTALLRTSSHPIALLMPNFPATSPKTN